jgi:hypothetical protein
MVKPRWPADITTSETVVPGPSRREVEQAVEDLDGVELNDLYLRTADPQTFMGIGGGGGRYMVTICESGQRIAQLINSDDPSDVPEHIMCGGQQTTFPRRHLVDQQTALTAAVHFLTDAAADPALTWEWYS